MLLEKRIPIRFFFEKIRFDILAISLYSLIFAFVNQEYIVREILIPEEVPMIMGTIISLLLTFRTGQAYDRWWEGRIVWGAIVNDSRTLIRQIKNFYQDGDAVHSDFIRDFAHRQILWCYCLGEDLRGKIELDFTRYLYDDTAELISRHTSPTNGILGIHSARTREAFKAGHINQFQQIQIDSTIARLCDHMGMAERIKNTIFPKTYSVLLHSFIYVFATILPFSLMDYSIAVRVTATVLVATLFFLVERTAIYLQDPFEGRQTDVPITSIARKIEINLLDMIGTDKAKVPKPLEARDYYIM